MLSRNLKLPHMFILLTSATFFIYYKTFSSPWLMDDLPVIVNNPDIKSFKNFIRDTYPGRPMRELSFLLDYSLFGLNSKFFHIQQLLIHSINVFLSFIISNKITKNKYISFTTSALLCVHPIVVESVINISHRKELLALMFSFLSLLFYIKSYERNNYIFTILSLLSFFCAIMSKQTSISIAAIIIVLYIINKFPKYRVHIGLTLIITFCIIATIRYFYIFQNNGTVSLIAVMFKKFYNYDFINTEEYYYTIIKSFVFMMSKLFIPLNMSMEYGFPIPISFFDPWVMIGTITLLSLTIIFVLSLKFSPQIFFATTWIILFAIPTSNIFQPLSYFAADRYMYTVSFGVFLLVSIVLQNLFHNHTMISLYIFVTTITLLTYLNFNQQNHWLDEESFFSHILQVNPNSIEAHLGMGATKMKNNDFVEAKKYFKNGLDIFENDGKILNNLATINRLEGDYYSSIKNLEKATLSKRPDLNMSDVYANMGISYFNIKMTDKAIESFKKSLQFDNNNGVSNKNLGIIYIELGRIKDGIIYLQKSINFLPFKDRPYFLLGMANIQEKNKLLAFEYFKLATQNQPENPDVWFYYGVSSIERGNQYEFNIAISKLNRLDRDKEIQLRKLLFKTRANPTH